MCELTTLAIASFALSAASAGAQYKAASDQAKVQTRIHEINQQNALEDMRQQMVDAGTRQLQEQEASSAAMEDRQRQSLIQASQAQARIGETGASGFTMSALMGQILGDTGRDITRMETSRDWGLAQIDREKQGIRAGTVSRMNSTTKGTGPSALATALQIGKAGVDSYAAYKTGKFG